MYRANYVVQIKFQHRLTLLDVLGEYLDVLVPVAPRVFVLEAEDVHELVRDDAASHATGDSQGDQLGGVSSLSYVGPASNRRLSISLSVA